MNQRPVGYKAGIHSHIILLAFIRHTPTMFKAMSQPIKP